MSIREVKRRQWSPIIIQGLWQAIVQLKLRDFVHVISKGLVVYPSRPDGFWESHDVKSRFLGI
jgi:hypothetical protein